MLLFIRFKAVRRNDEDEFDPLAGCEIAFETLPEGAKMNPLDGVIFGGGNLVHLTKCGGDCIDCGEILAIRDIITVDLNLTVGVEVMEFLNGDFMIVDFRDKLLCSHEITFGAGKDWTVGRMGELTNPARVSLLSNSRMEVRFEK